MFFAMFRGKRSKLHRHVSETKVCIRYLVIFQPLQIGSGATDETNTQYRTRVGYLLPSFCHVVPARRPDNTGLAYISDSGRCDVGCGN